LSGYINFSTEDKRRNNKNKFYEKANFPSIIGCIDCIHISIANSGIMEKYSEIEKNGFL